MREYAAGFRLVPLLTMLSLLAPVATVSALAAGSLPAIQIARLWRARSSAGISLVWVLGGLGNSVVWTGYALALGSLPLLLPNVLGLAMNLAMTAVVFAVRHPRVAGPVGSPIAHVARAVVHDRRSRPSLPRSSRRTRPTGSPPPRRSCCGRATSA